MARQNRAKSNGTDGHYLGWKITGQNACFLKRHPPLMPMGSTARFRLWMVLAWVEAECSMDMGFPPTPSGLPLNPQPPILGLSSLFLMTIPVRNSFSFVGTSLVHICFQILCLYHNSFLKAGLASWVCNLCNCTRPCTQKDLDLSLMLCCCHFDILNQFWTGPRVLILHWASQII